MKNHSAPEGAPCKMMEGLLQGVADGSLKGIRKAYAVWHASNCRHCGKFLSRLKVTLAVLRESKEGQAPPEVIERLHSKIRQLEQEA